MDNDYSPATEEQLTVQVLSLRYPQQGFDGNRAEQSPAEKVSRNRLMWATVYDLAKEGRLEDIRPDLRV